MEQISERKHPHKQTEFGNIPNGWDIVSIEQLSDVVTIGVVNSATPYYTTKDKGIPYFRSQNIRRNTLNESNLAYVTLEFNQKHKKSILRENDILTVQTGDIGASCLVPKKYEGCNCHSILLTRPNSKQLDCRYLCQFLNSDLGRTVISKFTLDTGMAHLLLEEFRLLNISKPPLHEQQKIAGILSKVDELIQKKDLFIEQTKILKKGLMQKLLTKGIGHTKFRRLKSYFGKYEEIPEAWELKKVSEIGEIAGGGTPPSDIKEYWNGDIPWAVPTDITDLTGNYISKTKRYITQEGLENSSAKILPIGTVLITSRATIGEYAINTVPIATNQGFQSLICKPENINLFMLYSLKFHKNRILRLAYGTTFLEISKGNIKTIRLPCPPTEEQRKVAVILSEVDSYINKRHDQKLRLKKLKSALMNNLLTGRIRVSV